eukprot:TRINITY_DN23593_c0_g1_i1.p1 TRINITY_DN23593_c0_g1~~TRINITY_DN23593_c0_g1_i1.p1  ORF type:complete len:906 (+),score=275.17 TRINITY_DN23593_c0_g1_i1:59-2719(+)
MDDEEHPADPPVDTFELCRVYSSAQSERNLWSEDGDAVSLADWHVVGASWGGPVALLRGTHSLPLPAKCDEDDDEDDDDDGPPHGEGPVEIRVHSSAGAKIAEWGWPSGSGGESAGGNTLCGIGWTMSEQIATVAVDGTVTVYDVHGAVQQSVVVPEDADLDFLEGSSVVHSAFYPSGVLLMFGDPLPDFKYNRMVLVTFEPLAPVAMEYSEEVPDMAAAPLALEVVPPEMHPSRKAIAFIAPEKTLWAVHEDDGFVDLQTRLGDMHKISVSPDAKHIAVYSHYCKVSIISADLKRHVFELEVKCEVAPHQLVWGGPDLVACVWLPQQLGRRCAQSLLVCIGRAGGHKLFSYAGPIHVVPECDGIRVLSDTTCDLYTRVPVQVQQARPAVDGEEGPKPAPRELREAHEDYTSEKAGSVKRVRSLLDQCTLQEAVEGCLWAALFEFSQEQQSVYLKAASFGKSFLSESFESFSFASRCKEIRVLNGVRHPRVGIPLTIDQYEKLHSDTLVNRLVVRRLYLPAFRISTCLDISTEDLLIAWACQKVSCREQSDERIARDIAERFKQCPGIPYHRVAEHARLEKRPALAIELLEREPKASEQIPQLLLLREPERALAKARQFSDTDLVYLVCDATRALADREKGDAREEAEARMMQLISKDAAARNLYLGTCKHTDPAFVRKFLEKTGNHNELASRALYKFTDRRDPKDPSLQEATRLYKTAGMTVEQKVLEDHSKLLDRQKSFDVVPVGATLAESLKRLIKAGKNSEAEKLKKEFGASDRMFCWIKLCALAGHDWKRLSEWGLKSKPVIGFKPFAQECLKYGEGGEALKYVNKIQDPAEKCEMFCELNMFSAAIDFAEDDHPEFLDVIYSRTSDAAQRERINRIRRGK